MLLGIIRRLKALIVMLTTLPLGTSNIDDAAKAFYLVPLIGFFEGVLTSLTLALSSTLALNSILSGALYTLAHILITGGIHLEGFTDYSDVIGARAKGDKAISILKDPHRGAFAIMALTLNIILTAALAAQLYDLTKTSGFRGFFLATSIVTLSYVLSAESLYLSLLYSEVEPYNGMARAFSIEAKRVGLRDNVIILVLVASIPITLIALHSSPLRALLTALLASLTEVLCVLYTIRSAASRIGYANGDVAGFSYELSRLAILGISLMVLKF